MPGHGNSAGEQASRAKARGGMSPSSRRFTASPPTRPLILLPATKCQVGQPCPGPLVFLLLLHPLQAPPLPLFSRLEVQRALSSVHLVPMSPQRCMSMAGAAAPGMLQLPRVPWTPMCCLPPKACAVFLSLPSPHCPGLPLRNFELSPHASLQFQAFLDSLLQQALLGLGGVALLRRSAPRTTDSGPVPTPDPLFGLQESPGEGPWGPPFAPVILLPGSAGASLEPSCPGGQLSWFPSSPSPFAGLSNSLAPIP